MRKIIDKHALTIFFTATFTSSWLLWILSGVLDYGGQLPPLDRRWLVAQIGVFCPSLCGCLLKDRRNALWSEHLQCGGYISVIWELYTSRPCTLRMPLPTVSVWVVNLLPLLRRQTDRKGEDQYDCQYELLHDNLLANMRRRFGNDVGTK